MADNQQQIERLLFEYLKSKDVSLNCAVIFSRRLARCLGEKALDYIGALELGGWTIGDIYQMDEISRLWRKNLPTVIVLKRLLVSLGCEQAKARHLAMEPTFYTHSDPEEIAAGIGIFRSFGFEPEEIWQLAGKRPWALLLPEDVLRAWYAEISVSGGKITSGLPLLRRLAGLPRTRGGNDQRLKRNPLPDPKLIREAEKARRKQAMLASGIPPDMTRLILCSRLLFRQFDLERIRTAICCLRRCGFTDHDICSAVTREPSVLLHDRESILGFYAQSRRHSGPSTGFMHQSGGFMRRLARIPLSGWTAEKCFTELEPGLPDEMGTSSSQIIEIPKPPKVPSAEPKTKRAAPANQARTQNIIDWGVWCKTVLVSVGWDAEKSWYEFHKTHAWLMLKACPEITALKMLTNWIPFMPDTAGDDDRVIFFASLLLDKNLSRVKRETLLAIRKDDASRNQPLGVLESIFRAVQSERAPKSLKLSGILALPEDILFTRLYVLRRILDMAPEQRPESLLMPWEDVRYGGAVCTPQGLSIVPPGNLDHAWFDRIKREMLYRVNETRSREVKKMKFKDFMLMLSQPDRSDFLKLLDEEERRHKELARRFA